MAKPHTRAIPSTGENLPVVGLGTWQAFDAGVSAAERAPLQEVLGSFAAMGGTVVDSSPMYRRSEQVIGDLSAAAGLQGRFFIATKVWTTGKAEGIRQMQASMEKLRARRIDLMQVHNLVDVKTHLQTLREWKAEGRVRYIGVTHYTAGAHAAVAQTLESEPVDFVQINYSVVEREAEQRVLPLARDRGIAVLANRPFAEGALMRGLANRPLPAWAGEIDSDSWPELLLKFVISHPAVTCAIPATSNVSHLRNNMRAAFGRMPDDDLRERIAGAINAA